MEESLLPKDKHLMTYSASTLDPVINVTDPTEFKNRVKTKIEQKIFSRMEELKKEFEKLAEEFNINKMVLESEIRIEPIVGEIYHLYENKEGKNQLSILEPEDWEKSGNDWQMKHISSVRLTSDGIWEEAV
jgi:predicted nucleotide-binding protein (sugar kinase/HSP70/actin superfamily)